MMVTRFRKPKLLGMGNNSCFFNPGELPNKSFIRRLPMFNMARSEKCEEYCSGGS